MYLPISSLRVPHTSSRTLPQCHRVTAPPAAQPSTRTFSSERIALVDCRQGGAVGGLKKSVRPGKPPSVQVGRARLQHQGRAACALKVRTDTRRGHNVTLIQGLEACCTSQDPPEADCQSLAIASVLKLLSFGSGMGPMSRCALQSSSLLRDSPLHTEATENLVSSFQAIM